MPDPTVVLLGNSAQMMLTTVEGLPRTVRAEHLNQAVTRVELWPGVNDPEFVELTLSTDNDRVLSNLAGALDDEHRNHAVALAELDQILNVHSGGQKPDWVDSEDEGLAKAIAAYYGCELGQPRAVLTLQGRDDVHAQNLSASQPAPYIYGALSANTSTPANTDLSLTGEITTSGGGLIRAVMTFAHTSGTNTSTLTKTWTANSNDALAVTISKWAAFNAGVSGNMGYEDLLGTAVPLNSPGDNATITFTLTAG